MRKTDILSDLLYVFVILTIFITGFSRPHIALMGVVWVDVFKPHNFSTAFLSTAPLSLICTLFFFLSFFLNIKKLSTNFNKTSLILVIIFMLWITITTSLSAHAYLSWVKWDWAFKILFVTCFFPFVLNSKIKINVFIGVWLAAISYYFIVGGIKTVLSGGGYGIHLIDGVKDKSGLVESSTLSMVAAFCCPLIIYLCRCEPYVKKIPFLKYLLIGVGFSGVMTIIGTQARTGLLSLGVFIANAVMLSKNKIKSFFIVILIIVIALPFAPDSWFERMNTITDTKTESSAHGRVVVWRWTVAFANDNPIFGGGFLAHLHNAGKLKNYSHNDEVVIDNEYGKSFHNIIFEVLGEQGYIGLLIYLSMIFMTWKNCRSIIRKSTEGSWDYELGLALKISLFVYCAGGQFIGIAFQIWLPYLLMLSVSALAVSNQEEAVFRKDEVCTI
jgi:probable O-glycosylation ligase (exosortase A-associated)